MNMYIIIRKQIYVYVLQFKINYHQIMAHNYSFNKFYFCFFGIIIHQLLLLLHAVFATNNTKLSSCVIPPPSIEAPISSIQAATFKNIGTELFGITNVKQCEVRTSPNCLFHYCIF